MKSVAIKLFVAASGAFAAYHMFFLCSAAYGLYGSSEPGVPRCATAVIWSLQGSAFIFAPMALVTDVGLWFLGRKKLVSGAMLPKLVWASLFALLLCAVVNLLIFIPTR